MTIIVRNPLSAPSWRERDAAPYLVGVMTGPQLDVPLVPNRRTDMTTRVSAAPGRCVCLDGSRVAGHMRERS